MLKFTLLKRVCITFFLLLTSLSSVVASAQELTVTNLASGDRTYEFTDIDSGNRVNPGTFQDLVIFAMDLMTGDFIFILIFMMALFGFLAWKKSDSLLEGFLGAIAPVLLFQFGPQIGLAIVGLGLTSETTLPYVPYIILGFVSLLVFCWLAFDNNSNKTTFTNDSLKA